MSTHKLHATGLVLFLAAHCCAVVASGEKKGVGPADKLQEKVARIQELLDDPLIEVKDLPEKITLAKLLAILEKRLPKEKSVSLRLDEAAFGKELPQIAEASISLPRLSGRVSLHLVLRRMLARLPKELEADYGIRPDGVVITRPRLAVHVMVYDVRDVVEHMPMLVPLWKKEADLYQDLKPTDGPGLLVRLLANEVELRPWEAVQVLNGVRLAVLASPRRHQEIGDLIAALCRQADVAVVMNARLYEVDRAFYVKHVAPLFDRDKDTQEHPAIGRADGPLLKKIIQHKFLLESENNKLRPHQDTPFLSRLDVFRFAAGPVLEKVEPMRTSTGLAGVSFEVHPLVSPDRRYLRLRINQKVSQLLGIAKAKTLDVSSGKDVEVEAPNLRDLVVTGTVQLPDGFPFLMPVLYRPSGKENEDNVWLLVARPFIWIEEEVKEIRNGGGDLSGKSIWDSEVGAEEIPAPVKPATRLPLNDDVKEVLQAIITHVLTNPDLKDTREFYGTAKDKTLALVDEEKLGWPRDFKPDIQGYKLVEIKPDPFATSNRVLGIRLDKFDLKQKKAGPFDTPIDICLFNAGGSANGNVIGGCHVYYEPKRVGKRWIVEYCGLLDP